MDINYYHWKAYRQALKPLWELKRLRNARQVNIYGGLLRGFCIILVIMGILLLKGCSSPAWAYSVDNIANAIYKTEGGTHTRWPYGIKHHYKHITPRQACINTIKHRLRLWNGCGDFVVYLGLTYSPPDINPNWTRLVHYFLIKGEIK